jgi:hypothetical protein
LRVDFASPAFSETGLHRSRPVPGWPAATSVAIACAMGLAACGGGGGGGASTVSSGSGCELSYSLTGSPQLAGPIR